jgi:CRISPR system Cascade subunit CasE
VSSHRGSEDLVGVESKAMPARWQTGDVFRFEARTCPVKRMAKAGTNHREGAEVDAFLARCWEVGKGVEVSREAVYGEWLRGRLEGGGGAKVHLVRMIAFKRDRLVRRTQGEGRKAHIVERPDATLAGELEVADGAAFGQLVARGIGRHRAFGFGMLLLRSGRKPS